VVLLMGPRDLWKSLEINRTILALSIARLGDAIANSILFVMIPLYAAKLPHTVLNVPLPLLVGVLISAYGFSNAALQPFMGALIDRIGHYKQIIQAGLVLICMATLSFTLAGHYLDLLGLRIAQGLGLAMEIPPTMALMAIMTRRETRGGSMGFYTTMRMLGFALGPLIGGALHDHLGFNAAFFAGAGILFLAAVIVQLWVEDVRLPETPTPDPRRVRIIDPALLSPSILSAGLATFLMAGAFTLITTLENEFNSRLEIKAFGFAIAFSSMLVGRLLFQVPMGRLSDRFGRKPFVFGGLLMLAPITALLGEVTDLWQFIILRFVQGIAAAAVIAPALALAADLTREGGQGRQMSIVTMGFGLGIAFGPLMAGILSVVFFELPFLTAGGLSLLGAAVVYFGMSETVQRKTE
jgi:MFS family permease